MGGPGLSLRIAITGGSGFIGRHLTAAIRAGGGVVRVIDAAARPTDPFPWGSRDLDGVEVVRVDIADRQSLTGAFRGMTATVHLAGLSSRAACQARPLEAFRTNALGTANVLDASAAEGVSRVVTASSRYVAAFVDNGRDVYTATKALAETWTLALGQTVARLDNVYGPGQGPGAVVADFIARAQAGEPPARAGDDAAVPLLFVSDAVEALLRLVAAPRPVGVVAVNAPGEVRLSAMATAIAAWRRAEPCPALAPAAPLTIDPALERLGWRPTVDWIDGVRRTWEAWTARRPVTAPASRVQ